VILSRTCWRMHELGMSQSVLAQKFGMSQPAISMAVKRGEQVVNFHGFSLLNTQSTYKLKSLKSQIHKNFIDRNGYFVLLSSYFMLK